MIVFVLTLPVSSDLIEFSSRLGNVSLKVNTGQNTVPCLLPAPMCKHNDLKCCLSCHLSVLSWQRGDRRERSGRRRLHRAEWLWGDQWQSDGAANHDQCLQDRLSLQGHCCHPLLSICSPRQEGQGGGEENCLITSVMLSSIILSSSIAASWQHNYFCDKCIC